MVRKKTKNKAAYVLEVRCKNFSYYHKSRLNALVGRKPTSFDRLKPKQQHPVYYYGEEVEAVYTYYVKSARDRHLDTVKKYKGHGLMISEVTAYDVPAYEDKSLEVLR